jgi:hypothetical protein
MEEIIPRLWVGGDRDYEELVDKDKRGWSYLRCCKEGPGGHRQSCGYTGLGAPKDRNYLVKRKGENLMALNLIDADDPNFISPQMIRAGLDFIVERLAAGDKVLVACNHGHSRGPSVALMYLRSIGEMPHAFALSERIYHTIYPHYEPRAGIRQFARSHWSKLNDIERESK